MNINNTGNGSYTAFVDSFGIYYVEAFMDINGNFLHDADEPYGVYGGSSPQPIDIQPSSFPDNVNITMVDPLEASEPTSVGPEVTGLGEIFPNPFNSTAVVPFYVASPGHATLTMYDLIGRQTDVIVNGVYSVGTHQVIMQAGDKPSGLYFVELKSDAGTSVRRVLLLK